MKKPKQLSLDDRMVVIGAFRYYLGRMTISVSAFTDWLCERWHLLDDGTKGIIAREVEEAFSDDDRQRAKNKSTVGYRLGWDCDRASWSKVRAMYRQPTCVLCQTAIPSDVAQTLHTDGERTCASCNPPTCEKCGEPFEQLENIVVNPASRRARHVRKCGSEATQ